MTETAEPTAAAQSWRLDGDTGSMVPRSALDVLVDLNDKVTTGRVGEYQPVPLGFTPMDKTIGSGLRAGELLLIGGAPASSTPIDHPATQAAARALEATFGREPVYVREGGSIPICASFENILELPVVLLGFVPPDNQAHAPNEWMDLRNYETGIRTIARMWDEVAALGTAAFAPEK